ncbi:MULTISPECIES: hydrogen gas-evolving membrane-bound hydrogenase subunit E [unclassified Fusibacter]|uniref:hydrogen gas-evolving membrane-bound hydrogenase subunit E n=1 Tax=unclassified Fusibacter TaxID=2624464 RepID=UPI0010124811|nr:MULTISPECIES: hydrogen gas-evolving membrane-bound hydrogenase subunit E [unclassified Fusibacter]MCK8061082.1 hypothetical protein [Fusibacter sp. A2]NPE23382.1 hypothetical protein [Fusibacter sp. A1]RXV59427.1 hypothetical protein DWB64_16310 [Fusibacter sp. A1]
MKQIFVVILTLGLIGFLMLGVMDMPAFGSDNATVHNELMDKYINDAVSDTGAINIVSAMILDYRAFDTFIEASVIFTALICVFTVLKKGALNHEK